MHELRSRNFPVHLGSLWLPQLPLRHRLINDQRLCLFVVLDVSRWFVLGCCGKRMLAVRGRLLRSEFRRIELRSVRCGKLLGVIRCSFVPALRCRVLPSCLGSRNVCGLHRGLVLASGWGRGYLDVHELQHGNGAKLKWCCNLQHLQCGNVPSGDRKYELRGMLCGQLRGILERDRMRQLRSRDFPID